MSSDGFHVTRFDVGSGYNPIVDAHIHTNITFGFHSLNNLYGDSNNNHIYNNIKIDKNNIDSEYSYNWMEHNWNRYVNIYTGQSIFMFKITYMCQYICVSKSIVRKMAQIDSQH